MTAGRSITRTLLSTPYRHLTRLRRAWYAARPDRRRRLHHPVVSVGNLSLGGSGKTPVVAALAQLLLARGERPAILTRGYGRRETTDGVLVVSDGQRVLEPVTRSGDEPQMLARMLPGVPVLVSSDRYLAGAFAERQFGVTVSILDDGFQHVQLERTVDLLLISPGDLEDSVVPAGRLREPLEAARLATAVLADGDDDEVAKVRDALRHPTLFRVVRQYDPLRSIGSGIRSIGSGGRVLSDSPDPQKIVAFAGIARPERFFNALRSQGHDVVRELTFPDHHWYTPRDLDRIQAAARDAGASRLVTTEKDAVRCDLDVAVLPMRVDIEPAAEFASWLMEHLRLRATGASAGHVR